MTYICSLPRLKLKNIVCIKICIRINLDWCNFFKKRKENMMITSKVTHQQPKEPCSSHMPRQPPPLSFFLIMPANILEHL